MKKIIKACVLLFVSAMLLVFPERMVMAAETDYQWVIEDDADLLSENEEDMLASEMEKLLPYGNVIFSTKTLERYTNYEDYAEDTYYDYFKNEPGVIFQIDMGNRKMSLCASTGMEDLIGRERDSIIDNVYKLASNGDYYGCAKKCFAQIDTVVNEGRIAHSMKYINNGILALTLALIINFIVVFAGTRKRVSRRKLLGAVQTYTAIKSANVEYTRTSKKYSPRSSGSSSSSGGGGGGFSGGGGGGGFSGGSSSHGF